MDRRLKLTLGAIGALAAAVLVAALTVAATGRGVGNTAQTGGAATVAVTGPDAQPSPAAGPGSAAAARAARVAVVTAEAEVLGVKQRDLAAEFRQGTTLHGIADERGISQADFQARYTVRLTALLDQQVRAGNLTAAQEQQALRRLGTVPNWDQTGAAPA